MDDDDLAEGLAEGCVYGCLSVLPWYLTLALCLVGLVVWLIGLAAGWWGAG